MPAAAPRLTYMPDLLEEHLEEAEFLWAQRDATLTSPRRTARDLAHLDQRIDAHIQGVVAVGERALPLLQERLASDVPETVFAGAVAMLRPGTPGTVAEVLEAFASAEGARLAGLRQALAVAAPAASIPRVRELLASGAPHTALAAAEILAFAGATGPAAGRLLLLLREDAPEVRRDAWRVAALLAASMEPKLYAAALRNDDPDVREAAVLAAAWCRIPGALVVARQAAERPVPEAMGLLRLLAVLGTPEDLPRIRSLLETPELGPSRYELAAAFGHPALVPRLIDHMAEPAARAAVAAGDAFARLTGLSADSRGRVTLPPEDGSAPDEFEAEFQDEAFLPDPDLARRQWAGLEARLARATRIAQGLDISQGIEPAMLGTLDLRSRWDASLRGRFRGEWPGTALDLLRFPQPEPEGVT